MEADINRYFEKSTRYGRAKSLYKQYRSYDVSHGYDGDETVKTEWILKNILGEGCKCYYCGSMAWRYLGVDRDDSRKGHTEENSVCCCEECNRGKGEYTKEEFKKISEIKIYISKTIKTMETYELTRMEDYVEINNRYNREADPDSQKIKEIMNRMRKDLRDGVFTIDRCIQVEPNLHECMSGGHRLTAGRKLATTDGLIYPLVVVPVDLGGDVERVKKYIEDMEVNRTDWNLKTHIEHLRNEPQYAKLHEFMSANNISDYRPIQWLFGLNAQKVVNGRLNFSDDEYFVAGKTFEWVRRAYESIGETAYAKQDSSSMSKYRNLTVAVRNIYAGGERGAAKIGKMSTTNSQINDIRAFSKAYEEGFMAFAEIFGRLRVEAEKKMKNEHGKKTANAAVWVDTFYCCRCLVAGNEAKKLRKGTGRKMRCVSE